MLDFSASINPLGPPLSVMKTLHRSIAGIARYPDPECRELARKLATEHRVSVDQIVIGNGSNDLIHAIARGLRPNCVAILEPTFTEYLNASQLAGSKVEHWCWDEENGSFKSFDPERADLVWLGNPNNPTGTLWLRESLISWLSSHPGTVFVVDEAYLPFIVDEPEYSLLGCDVFPKNLIVLRSLTKVFALPGARLGYMVSTPSLADKVRRHIVHWSVNHFAQVAGLAALEDKAFLKRTRDWLTTILNWCNRSESWPSFATPIKTSANFVLLRLKMGVASYLTSRLTERGILIRNASNFIGLDEHFIRVSLRTADDNQQLLGALRALTFDGSLGLE